MDYTVTLTLDFFDEFATPQEAAEAFAEWIHSVGIASVIVTDDNGVRTEVEVAL